MALADTGPAPYAPDRAVGLVIDYARDKSLATPVTASTLARIGVEKSLAQRTLSTLKQLDLLTDAGELTPTMNKIRTAPTDALQAVLQEWLRETYKPIFTYVEPTDDVPRIIDQFRHYSPEGQRNRMVTLFLGLCVRAGMIEKEPPIPRRASLADAGTATPKREKAKNSDRAPKGQGTKPRQEPPEPPPLTDANTYRVDLASGGSVALTVTFNPFSLDADDREFVFGLVDKVKGYSDQGVPS
jgi:Family of unknown function (DUF5343)